MRIQVVRAAQQRRKQPVEICELEPPVRVLTDASDVDLVSKMMTQNSYQRMQFEALRGRSSLEHRKDLSANSLQITLGTEQ